MTYGYIYAGLILLHRIRLTLERQAEAGPGTWVRTVVQAWIDPIERC